MARRPGRDRFERREARCAAPSTGRAPSAAAIFLRAAAITLAAFVTGLAAGAPGPRLADSGHPRYGDAPGHALEEGAGASRPEAIADSGATAVGATAGPGATQPRAHGRAVEAARPLGPPAARAAPSDQGSTQRGAAAGDGIAGDAVGGSRSAGEGRAVNGADVSRPCGQRAEGASAAHEAAAVVGTHAAIEFRVVATKNTGRVTFLNSHDPYDGHFYVAVFPDDYAAFPAPPAAHFLERCIVVRGRVELYRGTPQIVLRHPSDVVVVGD